MDQLEKLFSTPKAHFEFKVATATLGSKSLPHTPCAAGQNSHKCCNKSMQSMGIYKLLLDSIQRHGARNMKGDEAVHGACSFASVDMRVFFFIHEYDSGRAFCHRSKAERRRPDPTAGQPAETRPYICMVYAQSQCLSDTLHVWYFVWKLYLLPSCIVLRIMSICSVDHVTSS
jgi:hypothetical protein